jgi:four helix bundle protein
MQDFRNLLVWQKAHKLTLATYAAFAGITHPKHFSLRDQLTRAAISVPANLAEGCGRTGDRELRRFVRVSLGSASELEYHLLLAHDLGLLPESSYERLAAATVEVKRMLSGLATRLSIELKAESCKLRSSEDFAP